MEVDFSQRTLIYTTKHTFPTSTRPYTDYDKITVQYMFRENARRYKNREHLGFRPYNNETKQWVRNLI
jgi:hypothetical protein